METSNITLPHKGQLGSLLTNHNQDRLVCMNNHNQDRLVLKKKEKEKRIVLFARITFVSVQMQKIVWAKNDISLTRIQKLYYKTICFHSFFFLIHFSSFLLLKACLFSHEHVGNKIYYQDSGKQAKTHNHWSLSMSLVYPGHKN